MTIVIDGTVILELFAGTDAVKEVFVGTDKVFPGPFPEVSISMTPAKVNIGGVLTFEASVIADTPVAFAWFADTIVIGGETGPVYERTTVEADNNVNITCSATDLYNQTTVSESQTMNVGVALSASTPDDSSVANGATATFSTVASEGVGPYTYQWERDTVEIVGATSTSYTTPATDYNTNNGEVFRCVVTDSDTIPAQVTTGNATLTVTLPAFSVTHTMDPASVAAGAVLTFVATASGQYETTTYQWQLDQVDIGGETAATYNRTTDISDNGKSIRCQATRTADSTVMFSVNTVMVIASIEGQEEFTTAGSFEWVCPDGVSLVCAVAVGGGGQGQKGGGGSIGGGGGGLGWKNDIPVVAGDSYDVVVGASQGISYFISSITVKGGSGNSGGQGTGGDFFGDGGGNGGDAGVPIIGVTWESASGAGGAGGYTGIGGDGGDAGDPNGQDGDSGFGGGAGGGGGGAFGAGIGFDVRGGEGGMVGLRGQGSNGNGGAGGGPPGSTSGVNGLPGSQSVGVEVSGGGAAGSSIDLPGRSGGVRLIWGEGRAYPATNTGDV